MYAIPESLTDVTKKNTHIGIAAILLISHRVTEKTRGLEL